MSGIFIPDCTQEEIAEILMYARIGANNSMIGVHKHYISVEDTELPRWIPVSEGLPNRNGVYNVTRKLKEGETIYFISDASYFDGQNTWHRDVGVNHGRPYLTDVIAWQPRPEPYKEGGAV